MSNLSQVDGINYQDSANNEMKYKCHENKVYDPSLESENGYFFGQGIEGNTWGILGVTYIVIFFLIFFFIKWVNQDEDGDMFTNIIHVFGFTFFNILFLLFIFVIAPFGYQFWLGRCKNNSPGQSIGDNNVISHFLGWMPFVASVILVTYPASLLMAGNVSHWGQKTSLATICMFFSIYSFLRYWPTFIKNSFGLLDTENDQVKVVGRTCSTTSKGFIIDWFTFLFYSGFVAVAGFVLNIAFSWIGMVVNGKVRFSHGINPIAMIRNTLITFGLVLTNLLGGLNLYENKKK
jgi:hypothetical protein